MSLLTAAGTYLGYGRASLETRLRSVGTRPWTRAWYVVEPRDWSISWDGAYLSSHVTGLGLDMKVTRIPSGVKSQVVHYGSRSLFLMGRRLACDPSNRVVFTWFHGSESDPSPANQWMIDRVGDASARADIVLTSSRIASNRLIGWGVESEKLRTIPLGVDSKAFTYRGSGHRSRLRERLEIPSDAFCVGSFHKDGEGWGEGSKPKFEKAPDVLVDAVVRLSKAISPRPVHVLLTGPARGYVKEQLTKAGIRYTHVNLPDFQKLAPMYGALDVYLIPSRDEGGPKGLLEAMSSGVPVVSTRVGMAADLISHGQNGAIAEVEASRELAESMRWLAEDHSARERIASNGRAVAEEHDWKRIAARYYNELYVPLMESGKRDVASSHATGANRGQNAA